MQANQFITSAHSSDTVNFRVLPHDFPYTLLTMLTRKIFNHLNLREIVPASKKSVSSIGSFLRWPTKKEFSTFLIFYQHVNNEAVSPLCSGEIVHLKILESDCLRASCLNQGTRSFPTRGCVHEHSK